MGTPEFAIPSLEALKQFNIVAVVTQSDKPRGRGLKMSVSPVKQWAIDNGIKVLQPEKLKDEGVLEEFKKLEPDYIVVASYGKILPPQVLKIPKKFALNVHPSLLPEYRGAAPVPWTLINGEKETGVTIFEMDKGMDTGRILYQVKTEIKKDETAGDLLRRLSFIGAEALIKTIEGIENGSITPREQDHSRATYAPMLKKEDGLIRWELSAEEINNRIRGMNPWPGCYTYWNGKLLKIWFAEFTDENSSEKPSTVVDIKNDAIYVQTGKGLLVIKELQLEGKKRMKTKDFLSGHRIEKGVRLGER